MILRRLCSFFYLPQATATPKQPCKLAADAFATALSAIPSEDWCRTWSADRTIMLRMTSKRVKELVDRIHPPADVRLRRSFVDDKLNGTASEKQWRILAQLATMPKNCRIIRLDLPNCQMRGQNAERLVGVLAQCPSLAHLILSYNAIGAEGSGTLAGVLPQCPALFRLSLGGNPLGDEGGLQERCRSAQRFLSYILMAVTSTY